jgi:hypothetical protein
MDVSQVECTPETTVLRIPADLADSRPQHEWHAAVGKALAAIPPVSFPRMRVLALTFV